MSGLRARGDEGCAGVLIREHRRTAGLSQRQLADLARVSIGVIREVKKKKKKK